MMDFYMSFLRFLGFNVANVKFYEEMEKLADQSVPRARSADHMIVLFKTCSETIQEYLKQKDSTVKFPGTSEIKKNERRVISKAINTFNQDVVREIKEAEEARKKGEKAPKNDDEILLIYVRSAETALQEIQEAKKEWIDSSATPKKQDIESVLNAFLQNVKRSDVYNKSVQAELKAKESIADRKDAKETKTASQESKSQESPPAQPRKLTD